MDVDNPSQTDPESLLERSYDQDRPSYTAEKLANIVFAAAKEDLVQSYEQGTSENTAVQLLEEYGEPLMDYIHTEASELDVEQYQEEVSRLCDEELDRYNHTPFRVHPGEGMLNHLYELVQDEFAVDEFDYVAGIFGSGVPPLYTVSSYFDAESVIVRYSQHSREDTTVQTTPIMENRLDLEEDDDVLLVDDCMSSGETVAKVGEFMLDNGAEDVYAVPIWQKKSLLQTHNLDVLSVQREDRQEEVEIIPGITVDEADEYNGYYTREE